MRLREHKTFNKTNLWSSCQSPSRSLVPCPWRSALTILLCRQGKVEANPAYCKNYFSTSVSTCVHKKLYPYSKIENQAPASVKFFSLVSDRSDLAATLIKGMAIDKEKILQMLTYSSIWGSTDRNMQPTKDEKWQQKKRSKKLTNQIHFNLSRQPGQTPAKWQDW